MTEFGTVYRACGRRLALFVVDADVQAGGGHLARSLRLARAVGLFGWIPVICPVVKEGGQVIVLPDAPGTQGGPSGVRFAPPIGASEIAAGSRAVADGGGIGLAVFDGYGLDQGAERSVPAPVTFAIDDLLRPHVTHGILDQAPGRTAPAYAQQCPQADVFLTGAGYALLNPALRAAAPAGPRVAPAGPPRVLVSAGLVDGPGLAHRALGELLAAGRSLDIRVVVGSQSPWLAKLRELAAGRDNVDVISDCFDLAPHYRWCDIAVGAGGVSLLERCCAAVPSVTVPTADNQTYMVMTLDGAATHALPPLDDLASGELSAAVCELLDDSGAVRRLAQAGAKMVDGLGVSRTALALIGRASAAGMADIKLRQMEDQDLERTWTWQTQPGNRAFFLDPAVPARAEHEAWFGDRLRADDRISLIVEAGGAAAGLVQLGPMEPDGLPVSIILDQAQQGRGHGPAVLRRVGALCGGTLKAVIRQDNEASRRAFAAAGFEGKKPANAAAAQAS